MRNQGSSLLEMKVKVRLLEEFQNRRRQMQTQGKQWHVFLWECETQGIF